MPAIPKHETAVAEGAWDAGANVSRIPDGASEATLRKEYAWVDPNADPKTKGAYKFPHHFTSDAGAPGAASLNGVRNALARLPQADVPAADRDGVRAHLENHLNAAKKQIADGGLAAKSLEFRAYDDASRSADFVASTDVIDAHGEIVSQDWQLGDYLKNPVVLFAHLSRDLPIGRATDVAVRNGRLEARIEFATEDMNPEAEKVWKMVRAKFLRAVSVGFVPTNGRYEVRDGEEVWVWSGCVLKEISVTPVPANPEALAKMKAIFEENSPRQLRHPDSAGKDSTGATLPGEKTDGNVERKVNVMYKEAQEKLEKQATTIAELRLESKAAAERAEKAEKAEAEAQAQVKAGQAEKATLATEKAALEAQTKTLAADRDAEKARADALESKTIELEVDALVGKKISQDEKALFVDLRKSNPELFVKMIAQRAPLRHEEQIVPPVKVDGATDDDLLKELNGGTR